MTEFAEHYRTDEPNAPITLYEGPITLRSGTDVETVDGSIELRWLPDLRIRFRIPEFPRFPFLGGPGGWADEELSLEVPDTMEAGPVLLLGTEMGSHKPTSITGILNGGLQIGDGTALHRVLFRVVNFGAFRDRGPVLDRMVWETSQWRVTITPVDGLSDLLEKVRNVGGYVITHTIQLERPDGAAFTSDQARHVGQGLFRWLSFIRGLDVNTILPVGFDSAGQPVWQEWGSWKLHRWQSVLSWADPHHGGDLARAFPGFMRLWSNEGWQKAIGLAIGWYVDSNRNASGLESAIVCAQMALELLAWECLVGQSDAMTADGFKRLNAPDRVRLVLAHNGIPLEIPDTLPEIGRHKREPKWRDIADAVVFVRNKIVHPEPKHRERIFGRDAGLLRDAWTCALWMLELLLLRLFEYDGPYSDRREPDKFVGKVAPVPWSI